MASLKYYRKRINVLKNMQKVMNAMRMIATIKMNKLLRLQASLAMFEQSLEEIGRDINNALGDLKHPLVNSSKAVTKKHVVVLTADRGMCGPHNASIYKEIALFDKRCSKERSAIEVTCIGNRGIHYCKRKNYEIFFQSEINEHSFTDASVAHLASTLVNRFLDGKIQELHIISNYYVSAIHQQCMITQLIPFSLPKDINKKKATLVTSTEPEPDNFIVKGGILYISHKIMSALYNSYLSEQAARMTAMENSTANSEELIRHFVKLRNRARQSSITNALIEIISGKEALKG